MVSKNRENYRTDFTVTADAARGISTESARMIARKPSGSVDPKAVASDLVKPGHVLLASEARWRSSAPVTEASCGATRGAHAGLSDL
jgi:3,4-dihydroxy-2-butanone 4-phosphate synthase